jgi:hypothetical protein
MFFIVFLLQENMKNQDCILNIKSKCYKNITFMFNSDYLW